MRSRSARAHGAAGARASRAPQPATPRLAAARTLAACARLHALGGAWEPAGGLLETARLSLLGEDGVTEQQLARLHVWSQRWEAIDPRLKELFLQHATIGAVDAALWHVLEQKSGQASGAVYGTLRDLWSAMYGYAPSIELLPKLEAE